MALYTEKSFNDIAGDWDDMQRRQRERQMQELESRYSAAQNNYANAQNRQTGWLESVLSGIGNSIKNVGDSLYNLGGSGVAAIRDIATGNAGTGKYQKEWDQYMKKNQYGDANMSDKDYYAKTAGKSLDAAATVSDLIPGLGKAAKVGLNVGQGIASGVAQNYIDNGANVSLEDNLKSAVIGGASSGVGQYVGGKLAGKTAGNGLVSKVVNSNLGKAALTGAASGAAGGALSSTLNGGDLGQTLSAAAQGAGRGAVGGATMAGITGLVGAGVDKLKNKIENPTDTQKIRQVIDSEVEKIKPGANIEQVEPVAEIEEVKPVAEIEQADVTEAPKAKVQLDPVEEAKLDRQYTVAKQKQGQALMAQYGSIDAPTARSVGDAEGVLTRLYDDYGLETPADVDYASKKLTGDDGIVTKMTRKLAASAGDISSTYPEADLDQLIIESGLGLDTSAGKALKQQIKSIIESTRQAPGNPEMANANDVLDMVKKLERKAADVSGKSGNNYHRATSEDLARASVINAVASDYRDRIWNGAQDISTVLTPETIADLKAVFPKNQKYQNGVDNIIAKATNGQELRHTMADLVNGSKISKNSKMIAATPGAQIVKAATSANPIVAVTQMAATKALGSDTANKIRAKRYANQASKAQSKLTGETPTKLSTGKNAIGDTIAKVGGKISGALDTVNTPLATGDWQTGKNFSDTIENSDKLTFSDIKNLPAINKQSALTGIVGLNNLINNQNVLTREVSRQAGLDAARNTDAQREAQQSMQDMQNIQTQLNNLSAQQQQTMATPQYTNPGSNQLDTISRAMELALNAGDFSSYAQLADLYQQAYKIYGQTSTTGNATSNLNATQQGNLAKLQSAETAIDQLEQLYNQAGGGQGRLGGALAEWGAGLGMNSNVSAYNNAARGLINQIAAAVGKTDSLNTEGEVQRALDLVPKITDTAEEAQVKLATLRNMLNANKQTYSNIYGV